MKHEPATSIAVLTGDLVASTSLGASRLELAFKALESCARTQADWHNAPLHFTRHRGDGWQVVLARPELALRSTLAFRAALKAADGNFDCYVGAAEGESPRNIGSDLNAETADVFVKSGLALGWAKGNDGQTRLQYHPHGALNAAFILADRISRAWTQPQASAILPFLAPLHVPTYTDLAERLGKSRQAVAKSLESAGHFNLLAALTSIEVARQHD